MTQHEKAFLFAILATKCPHCLDVTRFGLTEQVAYLIGFFGTGVGRMVEYKIMCGGCGYTEFVQKRDFTKWKALSNHYLSLSKNQITKDQFLDLIEQSDLPELKELLASGVTWNCACGEVNPPNFSECWKCNSPSPVPTIETTERRIDIGGGHPWEN